jgi:ADP-heptose:LPS heptosyltransferase
MGSGADPTCAGAPRCWNWAAVLRELDLLVTVDSGPMHVAAAVGTPVVAVFGPTHPVRTGPFGDAHIVVQRGADLSTLPAEPVIEAALEQLTRRTKNR